MGLWIGGGSPCRMSNLRNSHVAVSNLVVQTHFYVVLQYQCQKNDVEAWLLSPHCPHTIGQILQIMTLMA